jgi:hypothetical protein
VDWYHACMETAYEDMDDLLGAWRLRLVDLNKRARGGSASDDERAVARGRAAAYDAILKMYAEKVVAEGLDEFRFPLQIAVVLGGAQAGLREDAPPRERARLQAAFAELQNAYWEALYVVIPKAGPR